MDGSRRLLFSLVVVAFVLAVLELSAWVAGRALVERNIVYGGLSAEGYSEYLDRRHPVLGWPSPDEYGTDRFDASGSRPIPAFPRPGNACVSLYGDSMTYGAEVDHENAWSNVLARRLGCRVANYGVGGYGTDQAFLRFRENADDEAPVIVLGHLAINILRNVNQFRGLLGSNPFGLKPRFVLDGGGELELVPLPTIPEDQIELFHRHPDRYLDHEYFSFEDPSVSLRLGFPYLISVLRVFDHFKMRAALGRRPPHKEFYEPGHPSRALEVTARIIEGFDSLGRARDKHPLAVVIPIGSDFEYHRRTGAWPYQPLLDRLDGLPSPAVNAGQAMVERIGPERHPCELFDDCSGHFNEEGYTLLAEVVHAALEERGIVPDVAGRESSGS